MPLPVARIYAIHAAAVAADLLAQQDALLAGLPLEYVAGLPRSDRPDARLLQALHTMNGVTALRDGTVPLVIWLRNAATLSGTLTAHGVFASALGELEAASVDGAAPDPRAQTARESRAPDASVIAGRLRAAVLFREHERAEALAEQLVGLVDTDEAWRSRADVAYRMGKYRVALDHLREAVQRAPARLETWLFGFRAAMAARDFMEARRWLDAAEQIARRAPAVVRARAQLAFEDGEMGTLQAALRDLPEEAVFARAEDADVRRLLGSASVVVGDGRVSILAGVFAGRGIRTFLFGWKDAASALTKPALVPRWRALTDEAHRSIRLEPIDLDDEVALVGLRVEGLEDASGDEPQLVGMLEVRAEFPELALVPDGSWGALMLVDIEKKLIHEPRRLWVHDLRGIPDDDWLSVRAAGSVVEAHGAPGRPRVFLSYAREDSGTVDWLVAALRGQGFEVWKDDDALLAGDAWEQRIQEAIERADFVVVCLSRGAVAKRGYVQVELRRILAEAERRPLGNAFIVPVRLDDVTVPRPLEPIHFVDLFPDRSAGAELVARHIRAHDQARATP